MSICFRHHLCVCFLKEVKTDIERVENEDDDVDKNDDNVDDKKDDNN